MRWSHVPIVFLAKWPSAENDRLEMTPSDFFLHLSFKASHAAANGVAAVYAPLLQPANEPSTWRASLIPLCSCIVKIYSRVELNTDTSRGGSPDEDKKPASGTSECRETSVHNVFVLLHRGFNWQRFEVSGKDSVSRSGTFQQDGCLPTQGTEPRSSSWKDSLCWLIEPPRCCSVYYSQDSEQSP